MYNPELRITAKKALTHPWFEIEEHMPIDKATLE